MSCEIPHEIVTYFLSNMPEQWHSYFGDVHDFAQAKDVLERQAENNPHLVNVVVRTALGYVQEATAEMAIYQEAINKLFSGIPSNEVDMWLDSVGFHVDHNQLLRALNKLIANLSQNVFQIVQNFIQTLSNKIGLREVTFHVSMSPAVDFTFS